MKKFSEGLEYELNEDGKSYSVVGINKNCKDTDIFIPFRHKYLPVTSIADRAFYDCKYITSIIISHTVTSIGDWAFCECESLTNITLPDRLISIGEDAFYNCTSLKNIDIPSTVTSIGAWSFAYCESLTSIVFPKNASIGRYAILGCINIKDIDNKRNDPNCKNLNHLIKFLTVDCYWV